MAPDEARAAAMKSFGDLVRNTERGYDIRGGGWLEPLWQDLRYGMRMLLKSPAFTLTAILSLAIGIGANTALFSVINAVLWRPLPYPHAERLVRVEGYRGADFAALSAATRVFDGAAVWDGRSFLLTGRGPATRLFAQRITPEFLPLFETMVEYDLPIWIHPYRGADMPDFKTEDRSEFEIWWTFGWPFDTSAAMARLVFAGYFDRFPTLKIITHHMGAMIPYFAGRVGPGWDQLGARTSDQDLSVVLKSLKKRPFDYFKMFYADTALFGAYDATVCGLKFFGVDRTLFASDAPFDPEQGPMYIRETIAIVDRLPITDGERERIYSKNALSLLRL